MKVNTEGLRDLIDAFKPIDRKTLFRELRAYAEKTLSMYEALQQRRSFTPTEFATESLKIHGRTLEDVSKNLVEAREFEAHKRLAEAFMESSKTPVDHPVIVIQEICGPSFGARLRRGGFINAGIDVPRGTLADEFVDDWTRIVNERIDRCIAKKLSDRARFVWSYALVDYFRWLSGYVEGNDRAGRLIHLKVCVRLGVFQHMLTEKDALWDYRRSKQFKERVAPLMFRRYLNDKMKTQNLLTFRA